MKQLVKVDSKISWLPVSGEGRLYLTNELPDPKLCRAAFGFAFNGDKVLLARLKKRNWDIPGGGIEIGETPEQTVVREVWEETFVKVEVNELIGIQEVEIFGPKPENYRWGYPLSVQLYYFCQIVLLKPFKATREASERGFFSPSEARDIPTMTNHDLIYEAALRRATGKMV